MASNNSKTSSNGGRPRRYVPQPPPAEILVVDYMTELHHRYRAAIPAKRKVTFVASIASAMRELRSNSAIQTVVVQGLSRSADHVWDDYFRNTIMLLMALEFTGFEGSVFVVSSSLDAYERSKIALATDLPVRVMTKTEFFADTPPAPRRPSHMTAEGKLWSRWAEYADKGAWSAYSAQKLEQAVTKLEEFKKVVAGRDPEAAFRALVELDLYMGPDVGFMKSERIWSPWVDAVFNRAVWEAMRPHPFLLEMIRLELMDDLAGPEVFRGRVAYGQVVARKYGRRLLEYFLRMQGPDERIVDQKVVIP